jgi:methanogenic corrinoid protein MtbC1
MGDRDPAAQGVLTREKLVREHLDERRAEIAAALVAEDYRRHPDLRARHGAGGEREYLRDVDYRLQSLAEALTFARAELFVVRVEWERAFLTHLGAPARDLAGSLEVMHDLLPARLPPEIAPLAAAYLRSGFQIAGQEAGELPGGIEIGGPQRELAVEYLQLLLRADRGAAARLILRAMEEGVPLQDIYLQVFQRVQHEVGRLWQIGRLNVAQEHYCTAATQSIMSELYSRVFSSAQRGKRVLLAASIGGELHELGVRMVSDLLELRGWDTRYLGANVPLQGLLQAAAESGAEMLAVSATMVVHLRAVLQLIRSLREHADLAKVKILVGGMPFNAVKGLWEQVGADAYAEDAGRAVTVAGRLAMET